MYRQECPHRLNGRRLLSCWGVAGVAKLAVVAVVLVIFAVPVLIGWLAAKFVCRPRYVFGLRRSVDEQEKRISRWGWWRSICGFATVALVTYRYQRFHGVQVTFEHHWVNVLLEGGIAAACCVLIFAVVNHSWRILARAWRPALRFLLVVALNDLAVRLSKSPELNRIFARGDHSPHAIGVGLVLFGIIGFMVATGYYVIRYLYGVTEVNPLLGPVATVVAVLIIAVTELWSGLHSSRGGIPSNVLVLMTIVGVGSTVGLAIKEWCLLRGAGFEVDEHEERVQAFG